MQLALQPLGQQEQQGPALREQLEQQPLGPLASLQARQGSQRVLLVRPALP